MRYRKSSFCVLNPCTGEYFNLPTIDNEGSIVGGFGYDPSTSNYKIVRIEYLKDKGYVQVYTLGSSGWRSIGEINHQLRRHREGVLWKGSLHWLDVNQGKVLAFDLADETFRRYLPETPCININTEITQFKLLGGYLSIVAVDRRIRRVNIWALKYTQHKNDDILLEVGKYQWSLEFSIPFFASPYGYTVDCNYDPFDITKNNEVLLWHTLKPQGWSTTPTFLFRYDPKTDTLKEVLHWKTYHIVTFKGIPHVNSHVSLKALGVDSKTTKVAAHCADH
ncbi:F-box protein At1g47340-like [Papaver somniferum]|uniref:F-box protein At1g47340-like n=1 Tax=Papaver somniferum TaxID=3469 RepID=UPI000E6FCDD6|nr:F-box protein At1g47340-like [Papaver somniferum]